MKYAYDAIREVLDNLGIYGKDEELLESREEMICYEAQQVDEQLWGLEELIEAVRDLCGKVDLYLKQGCLRSQLYQANEKVKALLK